MSEVRSMQRLTYGNVLRRPSMLVLWGQQLAPTGDMARLRGRSDIHGRAQCSVVEVPTSEVIDAGRYSATLGGKI